MQVTHSSRPPFGAPLTWRNNWSGLFAGGAMTLVVFVSAVVGVAAVMLLSAPRRITILSPGHRRRPAAELNPLAGQHEYHWMTPMLEHAGAP